MKTLDKLLASVLAVTLVFSVLSVANPYYFVVGPSAYAENDDDVEEKSNYGHGGNAAHDSDREDHNGDDEECNPEDEVEEEAQEEDVNDDTEEDETSDEQESDNNSNSDESDEEESSEEDVSDEEQADEQEEDDVDEHEEESAEEENEVEDEAEDDDSEDATEDNDDNSQDTNDAEAAEEENDVEEEVEEEGQDEGAVEEETEDKCNNQGRSDDEDEHQVTEEEIKEKQNERRHHIVESITGIEIHQRHLNAEPMSVGAYEPGLQYSLIAAGVAEHGGVHTVEVDMDIAVWKSTSAIVIMDVLGGTVTVEGHAYSVAVGYALYSTQSDMMRVSALVVDEDTGNVFKLKLRGNAIGEDAQLPMNTGEALDMSFEGNSGPSKNEFAGAELDLKGSITST